MTLKDELLRLVGVQGATEEEQKANSSRKIELGQNRNGSKLWMCLVVKVKSNARKEQYYIESGTLGS